MGGAAGVGTLIWVPGMHGGAIELKVPQLVQIPAINVTMTQGTMAGWIKPVCAQSASNLWSAIMFTRGTATGLNINPDSANNQVAYHWGDASTTWSYRGTAYISATDWTFVAVTVQPTQATIYINGAPICTNVTAHGSVTWNAPIFLGGDGSGSFDTRRMTDGCLDDVSLWSRALTADEVKAIMKGLAKPQLAAAPSPADGATDVPQDTALSWVAGKYAAASDVYLGKALADVNSATEAKPAGCSGQPGSDGDQLHTGRPARFRPDLLLAYR